MNKTILLFSLLLISLSNLLAQGGTCATATTLTYGAACTNGTNTGANTTGDGISAEPACWAGGSTDWNESVWYKVVMPAGQTSLVVTGAAGTLTVDKIGIQIYSGSCGSLTEIGCTLGGGAAGAAMLTPGNTYFIMIDGLGGNDGTFCIAAGAPVVPNDFICSLTTIAVGGGCTNGTTVNSTNSSDTDPSCVNGGTNTLNTSWYGFVATDDSITVNFGDGTLATSLTAAVYSAVGGVCTGALTEIGCTSNGSEIDLTGLVIGRTYFVMIDGKTTETGTFCISVYETPPPPPPIGTCSNPRDLYIASDCNNIQGLQYDEQNNIISTNTATGTDAGASMAGAQYLNSVEQGCAGTDNGQQGYWVRFTGTGSSINIANYGTSGYDYSIFTGTPTNATCTAGLTSVACLTVAAADLTGNTMTTVNGTEYYMLITPSSTGTATTAFACITGTTYSPPNDNCSNATALSFGEGYELTTSSATVDNNNTLCSGSTENNVWVKYTATYTGTAYVFLQDQDCACGNGTQMSIYNAGASCPNNSSTCTSYINPNNDNDFSGSFSVTNGSTYYIQLDGYAGCGCTFNLCLNSVNSADCSVLLPVEMDEIEAFFSKENEVKVLWSTLSERDCDYFLLEQSSDGIDYKEVGRIKGNGTSLDKHYYYLNDSNPYTEGVSYYRIKQFDYNGTGRTYKPVSVSPNKHKEIYFYPNPTEAQLKIEIPGHTGKVEIEIYTHLGKKVFSHAVEDNSDLFLLDLENLDAGNYLIRVISESKVYTDRIGIK